MSDGRVGILHEEHLLLGARIGESRLGGAEVVSYPGEKDPDRALDEGALLTDLTGSAYLLVSGAGAPALVRAALCGRPLAVGEAAFEGCLSGDGGLVSVPLALRTGDSEHVLIDPTPRGCVLDGWLGFLSGLEAEGESAFPGARVDDATEMLVALLLAGRSSEAVLSDYVHAEPLPQPGSVVSVHLDAISALVARLPRDLGTPAFLVLVPVASARTLWRSLLSFNEVAPVGHDALRRLFARRLPWGDAVAREGRERVSRAALARWGIVREGADFVGARALGA